MDTLVLVGGIICLDGKVLLLKRSMAKKFLPGYYDLPGGKVNPGENPNDAIIREVNEETGLDAEIVRPYNVWDDMHGQEHCIEIDYELRVARFTPVKLSEREHSSFIWAGKDELPENMSPQLRATVARYFAISERE